MNGGQEARRLEHPQAEAGSWHQTTQIIGREPTAEAKRADTRATCPAALGAAPDGGPLVDIVRACDEINASNLRAPRQPRETVRDSSELYSSSLGQTRGSILLPSGSAPREPLSWCSPWPSRRLSPLRPSPTATQSSSTVQPGAATGTLLLMCNRPTLPAIGRRVPSSTQTRALLGHGPVEA
jgi:hypothetical protein